MMNLQHELTVARQAALLASKEIMYQYDRFSAIPDAPMSITTSADKDSQEIILNTLAQSFPSDAFIAEEDTPTLCKLPHSGKRLWVIDPIDGTRGFARKTGEFCVMIALVEVARPVVGVVYEPAKDRMTWAIRGAGCFWRSSQTEHQEQRAKVSQTRELSEATIAMSRSQLHVQSNRVKVLGARRVVPCYSSGVKLAMVARGDVELYLNDYLIYSDWDLCAGHILVEEAGGRMTDSDGHELTYDASSTTKSRGFLASNGFVHEEALQAIRSGKV